MPQPHAVTPVILSGGAGTRLWPLSRAAQPKQFLEFTPGGTMLAQTLARSSSRKGLPFAAPIIIGNVAHADLVKQQCAGQPVSIIFEPVGRNTAPAIALGALALPEDALMLVMPSDHVIADVPAFQDAIVAAAPLASEGWLVTFGIKPTSPETGYGYIRKGAALAGELFRVESFVEKPDLATAHAYLAEGTYCWNAGIFLFTAGAYMSALAEFAPEMARAVRAAWEKSERVDGNVFPDLQEFSASPSDSIDYAVMEKVSNVAVVPADIGWSDIGSWDALYDMLDKDGSGNVQIGDVVSIESGGCLVRSEGPTVTLAGVNDLIVIATGDAVMVLPRGNSQDVKKIVEELKARKHPVLDR